jgi:DNA-binding protein H-NS
MTVEALMDLREQIDETLLERRAEIEKQLQRMGAVAGGARVVRGRRSALKGKKVPPKYRSPSGETWVGRGAKPRWLVAAIKGGKKLDDFLIDKSARKGRKNEGRSDRNKAMAKAYKRLRRERTERRVKNQRFIEPSKRPLTGKRKKSLIRSLFSKDASEP